MWYVAEDKSWMFVMRLSPPYSDDLEKTFFVRSDEQYGWQEGGIKKYGESCTYSWETKEQEPKPISEEEARCLIAMLCLR